MEMSVGAGVLHISNPAELADVAVAQGFASAYSLQANTFMSNTGMDTMFTGELFAGDVKYAPRSGKNLAISQSQLSVGFEQSGWRFTAFKKQDAWLEIEQKTLDVLNANMAGRALPSGLTLPVDVKFAGYEATGIKLEKAFKWPGLNPSPWTLGLGVSALMGSNLRLTEASGSVQQTTNAYLFNVNTNDSASKATYDFIRPAMVSAEGHALDVGATYRINAQQTLGLAVNDAFSSVVWHNMPNTQLAINNQQVGKDANGFAKASLTGTNDINRREITQTLEPKYQVEWSHADPQKRWRVVGQSMRSHTMAGLNHSMRLGGEHWLELGWESFFNSVSLGYQNKHLKVIYRTRQPLSDQANVSELGISGQFVF